MGNDLSKRKIRSSSRECDIFFFGPENDDKTCGCVMHISDQGVNYRPPGSLKEL
jgi:hypothetical protein